MHVRMLRSEGSVDDMGVYKENTEKILIVSYRKYKIPAFAVNNHYYMKDYTIIIV